MSRVMHILLLCGLSGIFANVLACQVDDQRHQTALILYENKEFREFACGDESCNEETMEKYLNYRVNKVASTPANFCFVTTNASVKNGYQAIFTFDEKSIWLQLVVFANDIKIKSGKGGRTTIDAFQLTDDANGGGVVTSFQWNGKRFEQINQVEVPSFNAR